MWIFPSAAAVLSAGFGAVVLAQFISRRRPSQLAWACSLFMFAIASGCAAFGILRGWSPGVFRTYYLFGAVINVLFLGLGTLYTVVPRRVGHVVAVIVVGASVYGAGATATANLAVGALHTEGIPAGAEVVPAQIRALSRYFSYAGFAAVLGGALWSAWQMSRRQEDERGRRRAGGLVLLAAGTVIVAAGSSAARFGRGSVFAVALAVGVAVMFAGFLKAR